MSSQLLFTTADVEMMGKFANNIGIYASQLLYNNRSDLAQRALFNLAKLKKEDGGLLKRLDQTARDQNDQSPLRLIEDLSKLPESVAGVLDLVYRCLLATAFLGHCIALSRVNEAAVAALGTEKRLH